MSMQDLFCCHGDLELWTISKISSEFVYQTIYLVSVLHLKARDY